MKERLRGRALSAVSGEQGGTGSAGEQNTAGICSSAFQEGRARSSSPALTVL